MNPNLNITSFQYSHKSANKLIITYNKRPVVYKYSRNLSRSINASYSSRPSSQHNNRNNNSDSNSDLDNFKGLTEEEDWVVPGNSRNLGPSSPLGQAIRSACDEIETLSQMEKDVASKAFKLLKKLGYKGPKMNKGNRNEKSSSSSSSD